MKRIVWHESVFPDSEWQCHSPRVDPHPNDVGIAGELTPARIKRYIADGIKEVNSYVSDMPLDSPKWRDGSTSTCTTYGTNGSRDWRTHVTLKLDDLGHCILGRVVMNDKVRAVLVGFPAKRSHIVDDSILLRIAALLPEHVRDKMAAKIKADGLGAEGTLAFVMFTGGRTRRGPPGARRYTLLLARAGLRWAERRDMMAKLLRDRKAA
jgi:hypothetical protein